MRAITATQAQQVRQILEQECGLRPDLDGRDGLTYCISHREHECREYRFIGALGFGGKFRNNGNCDNTPHVDCYAEHETPKRLAMIEAANRRLAELFAKQEF